MDLEADDIAHVQGAVPEHFCRASGGLIRHILQQLETIGFVEKHPVKGRRITSQGQRDLDLIAGRVPVPVSMFA